MQCRRRLPSYDAVLLWLSAGVVVLIGPAIVAGVPAWVVALVGSVVLVLGFVVRRPAAVQPGRLVRLVPWSVLAFAIVLFAVVEVVVEEGSSLLGSLFGTGDSLACAVPPGRHHGSAGQRRSTTCRPTSSSSRSPTPPTGWSRLSSRSTSARCCWPGDRWPTCCGCAPAGPADWRSRWSGSGSRACSSYRWPWPRGPRGVARVMDVSAELIPVSPGVVRVSWTADLQEQGLRVSADEVRGLVESAFKGGSTRVEAHVDPEDKTAQRVATFAGLMREGVARGRGRGVRPDRLRAAGRRHPAGGPEGFPVAAELVPAAQAGDQPDADPLHRRPGAAVPADLQARPRPARRRGRGRASRPSSPWPARSRRSSA